MEGRVQEEEGMGRREEKTNGTETSEGKESGNVWGES